MREIGKLKMKDGENLPIILVDKSEEERFIQDVVNDIKTKKRLSK